MVAFIGRIILQTAGKFVFWKTILKIHFMTGDQFIEALYQCDFPKGDLGRPALDFYRVMLIRLMGTSQYSPTNQDLYDLLQGGFADNVPDPVKLQKEWNAIESKLSDDAQALGSFLVERIEWEETKGAEVRAEIHRQMGMGGPGLPANVEPIAILAAYGSLCKDNGYGEDDGDEGDGEEKKAGNEEVEEHPGAEWSELIDVFYYGEKYE
jgi:hypothetical protein